MMLDGSLAGNSAGYDRDGSDLWTFMVARKPILEAIDVEMLEWWHPILVDYKQLRAGSYGAGRYRSGAGCHMRIHPHGVDSLTGSLLAIKEDFPIVGTAGGQPGGTSRFALHRADGTVEPLAGKSSGVSVGADEALEFSLGSGGGHGDPLERDPGAVARDVRHGRLTAGEAASVYGVILDAGAADAARTQDRRQGIRAARLLVAEQSAAAPPVDSDIAGEEPQSIYPGVEQRGRLAVSTRSGAVLAIAPADWTDGCPTISRPVGDGLIERSYLDPVTGAILLTDVVPVGRPCSVRSAPARWIEAASDAPS
jgi:N-methylhydantoinase B